MSDAFVGDWLVREYVFEPSGALAGSVRQRRRLERVADDRVRVIQDCEPEPSLAGHAMAAFAGHHEFELSVEGAARRYRGPAVVGTGRAQGEGMMLGSGVWPHFGYNFCSFAAMVAADRQLTGGTFSRATRPMATIVGVGEPAAAGADGPELRGPYAAHEVSASWRGSVRSVGPDGAVEGEWPLLRRYEGQGWREQSGAGEIDLELTSVGGELRAVGAIAGRPLLGFGARYGWLLEIEAVAGPDRVVMWKEVLDAERGALIGFRRWFIDQQLHRVDVVQLSSDTGRRP